MRKSIMATISRAPRAFNARLSSALLSPRPDGHVLMLHNGRSGSTLLGDMMDQHPEVFWDGEVVEKLLHSTAQKEAIGIDFLQGRFSLDDILNIIEVRIKTRAGGKIFGLELQDYHMNFINSSISEFISRAKILGFSKFIYLNRNPIRKIVSHLLATKNDQWHIRVNEKASIPKIRINPEKIYVGHSFSNLKDSLDQMIQFEKESDNILKEEKYLKLYYDIDLRLDPTIASSKVCAHLGIPDHRPKIKFAKTADLKLSDIIENYSEVESALLRSGHLAEGETLNDF